MISNIIKSYNRTAAVLYHGTLPYEYIVVLYHNAVFRYFVQLSWKSFLFFGILIHNPFDFLIVFVHVVFALLFDSYFLFTKQLNSLFPQFPHFLKRRTSLRIALPIILLRIFLDLFPQKLILVLGLHLNYYFLAFLALLIPLASKNLVLIDSEVEFFAHFDQRRRLFIFLITAKDTK